MTPAQVVAMLPPPERARGEAPRDRGTPADLLQLASMTRF
jgi:hypothetical protein